MPQLAPLAFHNGEFVPVAAAVVPVTTQALQYGTGVFEGIRAYVQDDGSLSLFRPGDHYRRFLASSLTLKITVGRTVEELCDITAELLSRDAIAQDMYVRPLAYKQRLLPGTPPGVQLAGVSDALSISAFVMGSYTDKSGIRCALSTWCRPPDNVLPASAKITGGYASIAMAVEDAREAGYTDVILMNTRGQVAEASTANVFAVSGGVLLTPPPSANLLEGITRDTVLTLARDAGSLPAAETEIEPHDLLAADEVFLTGTGAELVPVLEIGGQVIGTGHPGPVTRWLMSAYSDVVRGRQPRYRHWLLPVPHLAACRPGGD
jgi:branched-chain amino acid aminotransferase